MRFGIQPARYLAFERGLNLRALSDEMGVKYAHVINCLRGACPPSDIVRERLPALTGVALTDLFTPESLAATYRPMRFKSHIAGEA